MIWFYLKMVLQQTPVFLVVLCAALFAIIGWKRHPRISLITLLALGIYIFEDLLFRIAFRWMPTITMNLDLSYRGRANLSSALTFLESCSFAGVVILLTIAIFSSRVIATTKQ